MGRTGMMLILLGLGFGGFLVFCYDSILGVGGDIVRQVCWVGIAGGGAGFVGFAEVEGVDRNLAGSAWVWSSRHHQHL